MRSAFRVSALVLVLLALLVPVAAAANGGPCPDDPVLSQTCARRTPPYYVVTNRSAEYLYPERPGSGCQPFILMHPACKDCQNAADPDCSAIDVNVEICQDVLAANSLPPGDVYEMCCECATNPDGDWVYRIWAFDGVDCAAGPGAWTTGLPPDTGIDLPAPVIIGGLALLGAALLAVGTVMRRRAPRPA